MPKNQENGIMDLTENLNLIGYSMTENRQLKNIDEVAEFICKNGKHDDVTNILSKPKSIRKRHKRQFNRFYLKGKQL